MHTSFRNENEDLSPDVSKEIIILQNIIIWLEQRMKNFTTSEAYGEM